MSSAQLAAVQRLLLIVAAWAAVETLCVMLGLREVATLAGAAAAVLTFYVTRGGLPRRRRRGDVIYWRGRAIDRDDLDLN